MIKKVLALTFLLISAASVIKAQDFSNKGRDFWVAYGYHVRYVTGNPVNGQEMVLYFATEAVTTVTVSIPAIGYTRVYTNIPANTIFTSQPIPKTGANDARLTTEGVFNKGIHITSDNPIVAYAHIYNSNVSGATLLFPTGTLGKEYYSINFDQKSNEGSSNCFFYAVAVDTGTTTIEVTPSANTQGMVAGNTYTFNLTQGQVFNALGTISGSTGVDLTGSKIRSISTANGGCKKIAVFSGSGKLYISCAGNNQSSADNYMVQAFPKTAWGKYYLTAPTRNFPYNYFRIAVSDPTAVVRMNGTVLTGLVNNFYYQVTTTSPSVIESDKPIMVAQYITTQGTCGNGNPGDPEVIYLSPVEQTIDRVILNSTPNFAIQSHFINVVIPNGGTGTSSFRIDGAAPSVTFTAHPQNAQYSYVQIPVSAGQHILQSDSGFNAIAYGYGPAESYGYNAGANVKDLYQFVSIQNQYATVSFPAGCKGSPFYFYMTFPYQPTKITWQFFGLFTDTTVYNPVYDSTWVVNDRTLYRYKLNRNYTINTSGTYPIRLIAENPTPDGCGGEQEIDYDLQIFDPPSAVFSFTSTGCLSDSVAFFDNTTNTNGRAIIRWNWDFGDNAIDSVKNPKHKYPAPGSYTPRFSVITDVGCISDTASQMINLSNTPIANFDISTPNCPGKIISFTDLSSITGGSTIIKWTWDFGDGTAPVVAGSNLTQQHVYTSAGTYTVSLLVESATGCKSTLFTRQLVIHPNPVADFSLPDVCLPAGTAQFNDLSTIADGSQALFTYAWDFGDGNNTGNVKNPVNTYTTTGPFNVTLLVTSSNGCIDDTVKTLNTIYAQPVGDFTADNTEVCLGSQITFTDQSSAAASTVTQWQWDFGDGTTDTQQNPVKTYTAPGTYTVSLQAFSAIGCPSTVKTMQVVINALPASDFTVSSPLCEQGDILFTDASIANSGTLNKWFWDFGDGFNTVKTTNAAFLYNYPTAGSYTVTLVTETDKGCNSPVFTKTITINPKPQAAFISPEVCLTDPFAPFIDTSKIASGSVVGWEWDFGDPNANAMNPNTSTVQNPLHRYVTTGQYTAGLIVTSDFGCRDTVSQTFTVNGSVPLSSFTVAQPNSLCSNEDVILTNTSGVDFGEIVKLEIFWDFANNPALVETDDLPFSGKTYTHTYPEFFTPFTKTYSVRVIAYSGINCMHETIRDITLLATPAVQFNPVIPVCSNEPSFFITGGSVTNGLPGSGVYSGPGINAGGLFNPGAAGAGTHQITYTYTGTNSCVNSVTAPVTVYPTPVADAGPDKTVLEGGFVMLTPVLVTNMNVSYTWTPATALDNPLVPQPNASPVDDITYTLTVTSDDGCTSNDDVFVKVLKAPVIPNAFSPNGDGINDRWEIKYLETYPGAVIEIFNRYGQLIYHSTGYNNPWDGRYNGKEVPAGTYYYIINPKNGRKQIAGFVDVLR